MLVTCTFLLFLGLSVDSAYAACSSWKTGTMTGYDNLDGSDDPHHGSKAEYSGVTTDFLSHVPVVSIHMRSWPSDKYHNYDIKLKSGKTFRVQSWDQCSDNDCGGCCTKNAKGGYLLDVERRTLEKIGIKNWDTTFEKVSYRKCDKFNPTPIAEKYHLTS